MKKKLHFPLFWHFDPHSPGLGGLHWRFGCGTYSKKDANAMSERSYQRALKDKKTWAKEHPKKKV